MLRRFSTVLTGRAVGYLSTCHLLQPPVNNFTRIQKINQPIANFTSFIPRNSVINYNNSANGFTKFPSNSLLEPKLVNNQQIRTVIKFSLQKGKRKTVKVIRRKFFRLHWGIWIRTIAGRTKHLWRKSPRRRRFLLNHVFCNATQSRMLDKMVSVFWRKPKFYVENPYEPYHTRENFWITRRKPWRPDGVDYE